MGASSDEDRAATPSGPSPEEVSGIAGIPCAYGEAVSTVAELDTLDDAEVIEGYYDGRRNDPEPTGNRSKSYWHGWRNGMADAGRIEIDGAMRALAHQVVSQSKGTKP